MGKPYVSEFSNFMNQYLKEHPKVVEEKWRRWGFFWKLNTETNAPEKVAKPKSEKNFAG
jgi:hypothetical protein